MRTYRRSCAIFSVIALCLLAGCGSSETQVAEGTANKVLHFANEAEPQALDPHLVTGFPEHRLLMALFEGLVTMDNELNVMPGVAESWELSDDKTVYTFHLREDAKWSNGEPVTAEDFVYAWRRILTPSLGSKYAYMLYVMENAEAYHKGEINDPTQIGATAIDDRTLEVRLVGPTPYFLPMQVHYTWFPVPKDTIEAHGAMDSPTNPWTRDENMVCNGPFELEEWVPNKVARVVRNEHYWDAENVALNAINFYPIESEQTEEREFRSGAVHMTSRVAPSKIDVYKKENPEVLEINPTFGTYYFRFNTTHKPLDDVRVRRALAMSIDREAIVNTITRADEKPASALTPPDPNGYTARAGIPYDIEEAKRLLAEAGYPNGEGFPKLTLLYNTLEMHKQIAEAVQAMWRRDLGVDIELLNQEWKVYLTTMTNLDYDIARSSWWGDVLDPINFLECFESNSGNNRTGWSSEEFDRLISEVRRETDDEARMEKLQRAEEILLEAAPIAPVYTYVQRILVSPDVRGWHPNMLSIINWKLLDLEPAAE